MFSLILTIIYRDHTGKNPGNSTTTVIDGFESAWAATKAGEMWEQNMPQRNNFTYVWTFVDKGLKYGEEY
jgi:hypothetical protein